MSVKVLNIMAVYGNDEDLKEFINDLVTDNKNCYDEICYYFDNQFDELSKITNGDENIKEIVHWYKENYKHKNRPMKVYGEQIEIKSDHINFSLHSLSVPTYQILYMFIKKYKNLKITNYSVMGLADYPYDWAYFLEGENGQYTKEEYRDKDRISWKDDLEFIFEYKEDVLNGSFTLTSANVYDRSKAQMNKHYEDLPFYKHYEVIPWEDDLSIMIEQNKDYFNDNIKISRGKVFNDKEITETEAKEMLEYIYNDESINRMQLLM